MKTVDMYIHHPSSMFHSSIVFILALFVSVATASSPVPGKRQSRPVALIGGTVHTVAAGEIEKGTVLFENGVITAVGASVAVPADAERIDVTGRHVYPGLINASSAAGLQEIEAVRATVDVAETGRINPNVRAEVAVNPESDVIPTIRANGIALSHVMPSGALIAGRSAVMMMDGWTNDEMTLKAPAGMVVTWPSMTVSRSPYARQSEEEQRTAVERSLGELRRAFDDARAYLAAKKSAPSAHRTDVRWEAMAPLFDRTMPLIVEADELQQVQAAVHFARSQNVRLIIHGGRDAWKAAPLLRENGVAVIAGAAHSLPSRRWSDYDEPFVTARRLVDAGILIALAGDGNGAMIERNLGFQAATSSAFGLTREQTLRAVTLDAARVLGVADRVGSIETGKDATLIVTDGDPLEIRSAVTMMFLQGKTVELESRHTRLWKKYTEKYRRLNVGP